MSFLWPTALLFLVLIPVFIYLYLRMRRRRQLITAKYGDLGFVHGGSGQRLGFRRHIPAVLFLIGLTFLLVAVARPQMTVSLPRVEGTVILAFDVSGSMAATDLEPTRMEAAKSAAMTFVQEQPSTVQIGIVAFSDSGFSVQAPTNDQATILATINRLSPERGTSLGNGILESLKTTNSDTLAQPRLYSNLTPEPTPTPTPVPTGFYTPAVIVLLTDGENNASPDPLAAAQEAANRGVRIYTVGIGSTAGTTLEVEGFMVHTQLNEDLLKQISTLTGGEYFNAENSEELQAIYKNLDPKLVVKPEKTEVTSIFAGISILILLVASTFSLAWFHRIP
jgi:Ca-activated chloride channel family protein